MSQRVVSQVGNYALAETTASDVPRMKSSVSLNGSKVGFVFDIIGRVDKPYVVVKTLKDKNLNGLGVSWSK